IKANGNANLFLINPSGIIFGENARLDIGGSFLGSTAESLLFENGFNYSAIDSQQEPILTVSVPLGLQMGSNPGDIQVNGNGHQLTGGLFFPAIRDNTQSTLQVNSGNYIALVAGKINLNGGVLTAENGRIELGSVQTGTVAINSQNFGLNYDNVEKFGDIQLTQQSLLDASGLTSRGIQLQGQNISFKDGSTGLIQTVGSEAPSGFKVSAAGYLELAGDVRIAPDREGITGVISSRLMSETLGKRKGADIDVSAGDLGLNDGGIFMARTYGAASGGDINVNVTGNIQINRTALLNPSIPSGISTTTFNSGKSGNINVTASNIEITDGALINAINFGTGDSGNVNINVSGTLAIKGIDTRILSPVPKLIALIKAPSV
ncbi:MAG: filamentous hemagglutinin N-terminal domain-containing protein, partial [Cyanobacteria bacterium J06641_2]